MSYHDQPRYRRTTQLSTINQQLPNSKFTMSDCPVCGFCCPLDFLHIHIGRVHMKSMKFSCTHFSCGYGTSSKSKYDRHLRTPHDNILRCPIVNCGDTFLMPRSLREHMRGHEPSDEIPLHERLLNLPMQPNMVTPHV